MFNLTHHSIRRLRFWLIAAAAILLITSILEAGHVHGVFTEVDDHCTLCQHSTTLDTTLTTSTNFVAPLLVAVFALTLITCLTPTFAYHFALIRAPPVKLQRY